MNWNTLLGLELLFCNIELFVLEPDELKHTTRARVIVLYHSPRTICFGTWWIASRANSVYLYSLHSFIVFSFFPSFQPPWYNRTGWLGVKHQATYLLHSTTHTYVSRLPRWLFHANTAQRRLELSRPIITDLRQTNTVWFINRLNEDSRSVKLCERFHASNHDVKWGRNVRQVHSFSSFL